MSEKINHESARQFASDVGVRDSYNVRQLAAAYLDLVEKAEAYVSYDPDFVDIHLKRAALRACLPTPTASEAKRRT